MMTPIHLFEPYVTDAMREAVARTLQTRWLGQGPQTEEFERRFEAMHPGMHAVAVGSGTDALHLAYLLAGVGTGDHVVAPLLTCTATNIPLLYLGAEINFYDVAPDSLNGNAHTILTQVEKAKAVSVVHYGGAPVNDLARIAKTCSIYEMPLIEDCAQALGGYSDGQRLGTFGDFACFSFQAIKHVTTGDGGMLLCCNPEQAEKAKRLRWFGIDRAAKLENRWANDITEVGYKYQMTDIAASMGIAGLEELDFQLARRHEMMTTYSQVKIDGIDLVDDNPSGAAWLCTVAVERRADLIRKLADAGIESGQVHYRNDRYSIFKRFTEGRQFPNMDAIEEKYLVLPLHMGMTLEDVDRVCSVIRSGW